MFPDNTWFVGRGPSRHLHSLLLGLPTLRHTECKSHKLAAPWVGVLCSFFPQIFWLLFSHPFGLTHLAAQSTPREYGGSVTSGSTRQAGSSMACEESTPIPVAFCILASISSKGRIKMEPPLRKHISSVPLHLCPRLAFCPTDCLWCRQIHWSQLSAGRPMRLERMWDAGRCSCCWRDYLVCHPNTECSLIFIRFAQMKYTYANCFFGF